MLIAHEHLRGGPVDGVACDLAELRWIVRVDGAPAAHHTLRGWAAPGAMAAALRAPLPRWSATYATWARELEWTADVRPRVLRDTDDCARGLGVEESAAALVVRERGRGAPDIRVEHDLVVLVRYVELAAPAWRTVCRPVRWPSGA